MSSGDYIRYRRVINGLYTLNQFPRVLTNTQYAEFKGISLEKNIVPEGKDEYWKLLPTTARTMSGVLRLDPTQCPDFCTTPRQNVVGVSNLVLPAPGPKAPVAMKLKDPNQFSLKSSCKCRLTF